MSSNVYSSEFSVQLPPINYMFVSTSLGVRCVQTISVLGFTFFLIFSLVEQKLTNIGFLFIFATIYMLVSSHGKKEREMNQIVSNLQFEEEWKQHESFQQTVNFLTLSGFSEDIANKLTVDLALLGILNSDKILDTELTSTDIMTGDKVKVAVRLRPSVKNYRIFFVQIFFVYPESVHEKE